jgi:hypothetical protein
MSMLPQPPPDAPAPPMSQAALRSRRWRILILAVGIYSILVVAYRIYDTLVIGPRYRGSMHRTLAINSIRQLGFALMEFESEYGSYPANTTIAKVQAIHPSTIPMCTSSSNDYFRQLLASEIANDERMFYASNPTSRVPDNVFLGSKALEKGECGFAYVSGLSPSQNPLETPIVVYPLVPGKLLFDFLPLNGHAVILRLDTSVITLPVDKSGHVYLNGKDLFDPSQPFWGGKVPDVKWPE